MVNLKDMAVVTETNGKDVLGNLIWYTVGEQLIPRDVLKQKLLNAGIDEAFMPAEIRIPDAFRRATTAVERKRENGIEAGIIENYLVKEVSSDMEHVLRFIVRETKDAKGKRLEYDPRVAEISLDKKSCSISWVCDYDITAQEMCKEAEELFRTFQTHHDSRSIRAMVYRILETMAPTPVRPSGGVYFVPVKFEKELLQLVNLLQSLEGNSEGFRVPVINSTENKDMIRKKLNDHIKLTLENLASGLKDPAINKSRANPLLSDAKAILDNFSLYQETLAEELQDMELMVDLIKKQMLTMLDKMSA
jgi:hypothetical protein